MEQDQIGERIDKLERSLRAWRLGFGLLAIVLAALITFGALRKEDAKPRVDARALDSLLRSLFEHEPSCPGQSSRGPTTYEEYRAAVMLKFDELLSHQPMEQPS